MLCHALHHRVASYRIFVGGGGGGVGGELFLEQRN